MAFVYNFDLSSVIETNIELQKARTNKIETTLLKPSVPGGIAPHDYLPAPGMAKVKM